jgi:hypothetical protein
VHDVHSAPPWVCLVPYARVHRHAPSRVYHRWSVSHSRTGLRDENGARTQRPSRSRAWPSTSTLRPARTLSARTASDHRPAHTAAWRTQQQRRVRSRSRTPAVTRHENGAGTSAPRARATVHGHMRTKRQRRPACTLRLVGVARFF